MRSSVKKESLSFFASILAVVNMMLDLFAELLTGATILCSGAQEGFP